MAKELLFTLSGSNMSYMGDPGYGIQESISSSQYQEELQSILHNSPQLLLIDIDGTEYTLEKDTSLFLYTIYGDLHPSVSNGYTNYPFTFAVGYDESVESWYFYSKTLPTTVSIYATDGQEESDTSTEDKYIKHIWTAGDTITAVKLNEMEDGIEAANNEDTSCIAIFPVTVSDSAITLTENTIGDLVTAYKTHKTMALKNFVSSGQYGGSSSFYSLFSVSVDSNNEPQNFIFSQPVKIGQNSATSALYQDIKYYFYGTTTASTGMVSKMTVPLQLASTS